MSNMQYAIALPEDFLQYKDNPAILFFLREQLLDNGEEFSLAFVKALDAGAVWFENFFWDTVPPLVTFSFEADHPAATDLVAFIEAHPPQFGGLSEMFTAHLRDLFEAEGIGADIGAILGIEVTMDVDYQVLSPIELINEALQGEMAGKPFDLDLKFMQNLMDLNGKQDRKSFLHRLMPNTADQAAIAALINVRYAVKKFADNEGSPMMAVLVGLANAHYMQEGHICRGVKDLAAELKDCYWFEYLLEPLKFDALSGD